MAPTYLVPATSEYTDESLLDRFNTYFRVATAVAGDELQEALRIRYQVYCVENPFENAGDHPNGFERDEFDSHSIHSLLSHRTTGQAVGTARLIMPVLNELERSFPVQQVCSLPQLKLLPLDRMAEVSRFSISKQFRRRQCDTLYEGQVSLRERRAMAPLMSLGLIQSLVRMSAEHGITHWCASMEPTLLRLLAAMSIKFEMLGPLVRYHGTRQPCYCEVALMLQRVKNDQRPIWEVLTDCGTLPYRRHRLAA
jgi:N-acyl amino acid synthase of PEP-CTERM/exosortase system